jgi:hypothetical protein
MKAQQQYVGLDVSLDRTSVCVVDEAGAILWRGHSTPDSIHATLAKQAPEAVRVGIETRQLSTWLFHQLKAPPILCRSRSLLAVVNWSAIALIALRRKRGNFTTHQPW